MTKKNAAPRFCRSPGLPLCTTSIPGGLAPSHPEPLPVPDESDVGDLDGGLAAGPGATVDGLVGGDLASQGCADGHL